MGSKTSQRSRRQPSSHTLPEKLQNLHINSPRPSEYETSDEESDGVGSAQRSSTSAPDLDVPHSPERKTSPESIQTRTKMSTKQSSSVRHLAEPALLSKIDDLFAYGVGDYIDLPQLVVVGDQSSGKSSVLEGLTKLPFPRDSGLCTRFATQITFRRSPDTKTTISIIPADRTDVEYQEMLRNWQKTEKGGLTAFRFALIMEEVQRVMGLTSADDKPSKSFSEDVLRLEISGPDQEHFSVVDVPGIFRNTSDGHTSKADMNMVKAMVKGYMSNPRSVMLTVIPANVDLATQDILTMAEEEDPLGIRTLGVLTKPDLVDEGAEHRVLDLIEGRRHKLNLGWCIVKNLGQKDLDDQSINRDALEKAFFCGKAPWKQLDSAHVGIHNLRKRLQDVLSQHIRREFPRVKGEIQKKLLAAQKELESLGYSRDTQEEQRDFLFELCTRFQQITTSALNADYASSELLEAASVMRLPTFIVARNESFANDMDSFGHSYDLTAEEKKESPTDKSERSMDFNDGCTDLCSVRQYYEPEFVADIEDFIIDDDTTVEAAVESSTIDWLKNIYENSRGFEIGTFDKSLLSSIMKAQSKNWEALAHGYIGDVILMVHTYINKLLEAICPDFRVRSELMSKMLDELINRYKFALSQVNFLLQVERSGIPATMNKRFFQALKKSRSGKKQSAIEAKAVTGQLGDMLTQVIPLDVARKILDDKNSNNVVHIATELHGILKSYYDIALKRFVDNVCMQASLCFLVKGSDQTPLRLFSPSWVSKLQPEDLEEIAGEDPSVVRKRAALKETISNLQMAKKILR